MKNSETSSEGTCTCSLNHLRMLCVVRGGAHTSEDFTADDMTFWNAKQILIRLWTKLSKVSH